VRLDNAAGKKFRGWGKYFFVGEKSAWKTAFAHGHFFDHSKSRSAANPKLALRAQTGWICGRCAPLRIPCIGLLKSREWFPEKISKSLQAVFQTDTGCRVRQLSITHQGHSQVR
jgi:hypothetical protein